MRMTRRVAGWLGAGTGVVALALAGPAHAGDKPLYQPVPAWVDAAPIDVAVSTDSSKPQQRIHDSQVRVDHGQVWNYFDDAVRIDNPEMLARVGTVTATWAPDHGDLIVHGITIVRGTQRIDALASGARFQVLRREAELESLQLNGLLTATLLVEGLRVGDVLDVRMSVTQLDPALSGHGNAAARLVALPQGLGFGRARLLWRDEDKANLKTYLEGVTPELSQKGGWHEALVRLPVAKQPDKAPQAPGRFAAPPLLELSDFADWADVSRTMEPLYRTSAPTAAIKPGGDLDGEVAKIAAATADPRRRIALALQLVQDKVRYFAVSMEGGNLVPQAPEQTWSFRYGDCKAKTLLLLAILGKLGIPAEAALANLGNGDLVHDRLPSVMAFNHVMVLAQAGGKTLWLDGTGLGTREADLDDVPPYHWVLPLRPAGATLVEAKTHAPAHPLIEIHGDFDMRAGLAQFAPVSLKMTVVGPIAGRLNSVVAGLDAETRANVLRPLFLTGSIKKILLRPTFAYDAATGTATLTDEGIAFSDWRRADSRYTFNPGFVAPTAYPDRTRTIWQNVPVTLGDPNHRLVSATIQLPRRGEGIVMEGTPDEALDQPGAGSNRLHATLAGGVLTYSVSYLADGGEFPASAVPAMRRQDVEFANRAPRLRTTPGYPAPWEEIVAARRDHLFDRPLAVLDRLIADKPDDGARFALRAFFHTSTLDLKAAIGDFGKVLALKQDKASYLQRAGIELAVGDRKAALADATAANDLDPADIGAFNLKTRLMALSGDKDKALALIDAAIAMGGELEAQNHAVKAEALAYSGDGPGAIAEMDAAIQKRSGNAGLLNMRCRLKGLLNIATDTAAEDCTRAIQLSDQLAPMALQNRAMVRFRQKDYVQATADLDSALDINPSSAEGYYLRALVRRAAGKADGAAHDITGARMMIPAIDDTFRLFGLGY